ncbi:Uncharacterized protein ycf23 [Linum perenne]
MNLSICSPLSPSPLKPNTNPLNRSFVPSIASPYRRRSLPAVRAQHHRQLAITKETVLKDFHERRALKVITGLQNFNRENVASVVTAADKQFLQICVSSVDPAAFPAAIEAGATMVEIGNYDSFYEAGVVFSPEQICLQIVDLTRETRRILPSVPLSVTVPHTLSLPDQVMFKTINLTTILSSAEGSLSSL